MKAISIAALQQLLDQYEPRTILSEYGEELISGLYIRWSTDPKGDVSRGSSRNWASGQGEMGLSVVETHHSQTWHGLDLGETLADRIAEYSFFPGPGRPWIVEGFRPRNPRLMRGSDNEPLILFPRAVAWVDLAEEV